MSIYTILYAVCLQMNKVYSDSDSGVPRIYNGSAHSLHQECHSLCD